MFVNFLAELGDGGMAEHLRESAMTRGYLGLAVVFVWHSAQRGGLISGFQEFSASINKAFIFAVGVGHWAIILWGLDNFLIFPNFLRS